MLCVFLSSSCVICVVLIRRFNFCHHVVTFSCVSTIQTTKYIQSDRDIESNHDCQYVIKLESCILVII